MRYGFIYETTNTISGKKYIGKCATTVNDRDIYLGSGVALKEDIKKLGRENFKREILQYADSEEELQQLELHYLKEAGIPNDNYYNKRITQGGGERYSRMPEETLTRKMESLREHATGSKNAMYEKEKTLKQKTAVSKANSRAVTIDGIKYPSMTQASKELGINVTTIAFRLDSPLFVNYVRDVPKKKHKSGNASNKKKRVSIQGKIYNSRQEASESLGCSPTKVTKRCNAEWCEDWFFL